MVRTKDEIMNSIRGFIGDNHGDEALNLLEDMTDTFGDYERRLSESGDWENKYNENDAAWRKRYADRFYGGGVDTLQTSQETVTVDTPAEESDGTELAQTVEDLFK